MRTQRSSRVASSIGAAMLALAPGWTLGVGCEATSDSSGDDGSTSEGAEMTTSTGTTSSEAEVTGAASGGATQTASGGTTQTASSSSGASGTGDPSTTGTEATSSSGSSDESSDAMDESTSLTGEDTSGESGDETGDDEGDPWACDDSGPVQDVDILFVVDNSGSMADKQRRLLEAVEGLVQILESPALDINYRLGVTTTDYGNPWCAAGAEAARLQLQSCRAHLQDFIFEGAETVDRTDACTQVCPEAWSVIETEPSATHNDDEVRPRPWIERIDGNYNLPEGLDITEALRCVIPQGIAGCGFEQPLQATRNALLRASLPDDGNYGFVRPHASLVIFIVTDEVDCSYNSTHSEIFSSSGNKVFWSNPGDDDPTSAICWNAGVACEDGACVAADYDVNGLPVEPNQAPADAVLHPVAGYIDSLDALLAQKQAVDPRLTVRVAAIVGVPEGYSGELVYSDQTDDTEFLELFGIAPGCESEAGKAPPPVRIREFAQAFAAPGSVNLYSVCGSDFAFAFDTVADAVCP